MKIKRNDIPASKDISETYLWLFIEPAIKICRLNSHAEDSSSEVQEIFFEQGYLKFNDQTGTYIEKFNSSQHQLVNKTGEALPHLLAEAICNYLKSDIHSKCSIIH